MPFRWRNSGPRRTLGPRRCDRVRRKVPRSDPTSTRPGRIEAGAPLQFSAKASLDEKVYGLGGTVGSRSSVRSSSSTGSLVSRKAAWTRSNCVNCTVRDPFEGPVFRGVSCPLSGSDFLRDPEHDCAITSDMFLGKMSAWHRNRNTGTMVAKDKNDDFGLATTASRSASPAFFSTPSCGPFR